MPLEIIPQSLFSLGNIKVMLRDSNAAVLYKSLTSDLLDKAVFITVPLILYVSRGTQKVLSPEGKSIIVNEVERSAIQLYGTPEVHIFEWGSL